MEIATIGKDLRGNLPNCVYYGSVQDLWELDIGEVVDDRHRSFACVGDSTVACRQGAIGMARFPSLIRSHNEFTSIVKFLKKRNIIVSVYLVVLFREQNKMAETISWLNNKGLAKILQKQIPHLSENDILSFKLKKETSEGNNYSSRLLKLVVNLNDKTDNKPKQIALFSKIVIDCAFGRMLEETGILAKENLMYSSVLPQINALLGDDSVSPIPYHSPQLGTIILEDLSERGYKLINRIEQLDYQKATFVLKKLAKLHAASVAVHKKDAALIEEAGKEIGLDETFKDKFVTFLENALAIVADRLDKWREIENHRKYAECIRDVQKTFYASMLKARKATPGSIQVLNHGDLWLTNVLFKFDENTLKDCKFVDFQLSTYGSPVIDLHALLAANVQFQVFYNSQEALLQEYLSEFNSHLARLKTDSTLSYEDLKAEYDRTQIFSFYSGIVTLIPMMADSEQANDFSNSSEKDMAESSLFNTVIDSKYYRKAIPNYLKYFTEKGILNIDSV